MNFSFTRATRAAAFALVTLLLAAPADAQVQLKWKLKKGEKLNYEMVVNTNIDSMAGKMTMKQVMDMSWNVTAVKSDGSATLEQKITRVRMTMDNPMLGKIEYDSNKGAGDNPIAKQLGKSMGAIVNAKTTLTLTPYGEVKDLKLSKEFEEAIKKAGTGAGGLGGGINGDTLKQIVGQMGAVFPKKTVSKGDTWKHNIKSKLPFGEMKVDSTQKFTGMQSVSGNKVARIENKSSFTMVPKAGFPGKITIKDKGSKGTTYFSVEKGRLVSMSGVQNMEMNVSVAGRNITMSMKSVTEMKLKK